MEVKFENTVNLCGLVVENTVEEKTLKIKGVDSKVITGAVTLRMPYLINSQEVTLEIPVSFFATYKTKEGKISKLYNTLTNLLDLKTGVDYLQVNNATIAMNEYANRMNKITSFPMVRGTFFNVLSEEKAIPQATFKLTCILGKKEFVVDAEGVETGAYAITAIVPQYGDFVDVVPLTVYKPEAISYIEENYPDGATVNLYGVVNFSTSTQEIKEEVGFGEPTVTQRTVYVSELVVTGGGADPVPEEFTLDSSVIKERLALRTARLEDKIKAAQEKTKEVPQTNDLGF